MGLALLGQRCLDPKRLGAGLEAKEGAGHRPVRDIWDRLGSRHGVVLSYGARTPDGLARNMGH